MQRRRFLQHTLVGALAVGTTGFGWPSAPNVYALARPGLLALLGDPEKIRRLGLAYRAQVPEEADAATLIALLAADEHGLEARVRADFAAGHTVCLHGWVLARTEARQCALASLLPA